MYRSAVFALLFVFFGASATLGDEYDTLHQKLGTLPDFKLTDQTGTAVGREQLLGRVCVISVFFSCCIDSCPITQKTMEKMQERFAGCSDILLVSINVFPGRDTPSLITQYAADHHADPAQWLFLHGDKEEIYNLVQKGLLQGLAEDTSGGPGREVVHTPNFLVVDHRGVIRGYVNGTKSEEVMRLEKFVHQLVQAKYFPSVNAGLNAFSGALLVLGFVFIRRRQIVVHKICMLAALLVSSLFLGCYAYYHFAVQDGRPTAFSGEGLMRLLYYGILLSHIVLAAAVAPLALRVTYLGLRDRLAGHITLARWTLPIWLYVSVTGVVVYWMLYHLYPPG